LQDWLKNFETKPNNNILERLNGTFRERTKVMRSLDSAIGVEEFTIGMQVLQLHPASSGNRRVGSGIDG
jgi:transposase-like protein